MGLRARFACVVSGDSLAQRKPHPLPLLHAAMLGGSRLPANASMWATRSATCKPRTRRRMPALVANYGYLRADEDSTAWGGDGYLERPLDLLEWLKPSGRAMSDAGLVAGA